MTDYQIKHIHIDNQFIMYKMFFWPKHSMSIRFDKKTHSIHVYVNRFISQEQIDVYVKTNISRFYRYLQKYKAGVRIDLNLRYIYLLNEKYQLHVVPTCRRRKYEIFNKNIYLSANSNADRIFLIKKIFSDYCKHFIVPLFQKWVKIMKLNRVNLTFRWMVSRYGVCNQTVPHKITLALQSISYRQEVIEYLIVHELVHILHPNHQNSFWKCVETYLPNWKMLDHELTKNTLDYLDE